MRELKQILERVIKRGYPEFLDYRLDVEYADLKDAFAVWGELESGGYYIEVDNEMKRSDEQAKIGLLAHELSHIVEDNNMNSRWTKLKNDLLYSLSKRYETLCERDIDLLVILRGFGQELYSFAKFVENKGYHHDSDVGLSLRELEILLGKK